jgi:hypothetical protein
MFKGVFCSRSDLSLDEQPDGHSDQKMPIAVVEKHINLPYNCARRTTCCAVEADILAHFPSPMQRERAKSCEFCMQSNNQRDVTKGEPSEIIMFTLEEKRIIKK